MLSASPCKAPLCPPDRNSTQAGVSNYEESSFDGGSSLIQTEYGLRADYELLRSLIVSGLVGFEIDDYQGAGREDDYVKAGLSALYYVNRSWAVGVNYRYTNLDSDAVSEYSRNQIGLTVKAQY
jgi:hypothetical protein